VGIHSPPQQFVQEWIANSQSFGATWHGFRAVTPQCLEVSGGPREPKQSPRPHSHLARRIKGRTTGTRPSTLLRRDHGHLFRQFRYARRQPWLEHQRNAQRITRESPHFEQFERLRLKYGCFCEVQYPTRVSSKQESNDTTSQRFLPTCAVKETSTMIHPLHATPRQCNDPQTQTHPTTLRLDGWVGPHPQLGVCSNSVRPL